MKTLDTKLAALAANPAGDDFVICYAADPDSGGGLRPTIGQGVHPDPRRDQMAVMVDKADIDIDIDIDILLVSVSTMAHK